MSLTNNINNKNRKTVIMNRGNFYAAEVFAFSLLRYLNDNNIKFIRTSNKKIIDLSNYCLGVGKIYIPELGRFDWHNDKKEYFEDYMDIHMSCAGMVYKYHGIEILKKICSNEGLNINYEELHSKIYKTMVMEIDGMANGINQSHSFSKYYINTGINSVVRRMNNINPFSSKQNINFINAVDYVFKLFKTYVIYYAERQNTYDEDLFNFELAVKDNNTKIFDKKKRIIVIDKECPNWLQCLREFEKDNENSYIHFVIFPRLKNHWSIYAVPKKKFGYRSYLIDECELYDKITDISSIHYVHDNCFTGATTTKESAIEICQLSLKK